MSYSATNLKLLEVPVVKKKKIHRNMTWSWRATFKTQLQEGIDHRPRSLYTLYRRSFRLDTFFLSLPNLFLSAGEKI